MSGSTNRFMQAWAQPSEAETQPNALLRPSPVELAPTAMTARDRVIAWLDAQQKLSEQRGLWTGGQVWEGGHPTVAGVADAAQQLASNFEGGIKAFHGSPHSFERFSSENIGTGEGAQAYGHGLYFAGNEGVARSYRDDLSPANVRLNGKVVPEDAPDFETLHRLANHQYSMGRSTAEQVAWAQQHAEDLAPNLTSSDPYKRQAAEWARDWAKQTAPYADKTVDFAPAGHMYEVNIAADPEHMLDWDKPLSEQSQHVQDQVTSLWPPTPDGITRLDSGRWALTSDGKPVGRTDGWPDMGTAQYVLQMLRQDAKSLQGMSGEQLYRHLGGKATGGAFNATDAANTLREAGIPGIRYLDQQSRNPPIVQLVGGKAYDPADPVHGASMALTWTNGDRSAAAAQLDKLAQTSPNSAEQMRGAAQVLRSDQVVPSLTEGPAPGTHNYVVFDDSLIDVLRKYGIAGLGIGLGAAATQRNE